jgi:hypothetical protein
MIGGPAGEDQQRVVRAHVPIHHDRVEGRGQSRTHDLAQRPPFDTGVSQYVRKHRRHVGRDHARALRHSRDGHFSAGNVDLLARKLREGIRRHDPFQCVVESTGP